MILLVRASDITRDEDGNVISFRAGETVTEFKTAQEFTDWVDAHAAELDDNMQPFSGSASLFTGALAYLNNARKAVKTT